MSKKRILIMDDDELIRDLLNEMIDILGYDAVIVKNGDEAVISYKSALEEKRPFELVILDLTVSSGMGGIDTIKKLKELDPNVKVIVSSGHDISEQEYKQYGFHSAIKKPFTFDTIKRVLQEII